MTDKLIELEPYYFDSPDPTAEAFVPDEMQCAAGRNCFGFDETTRRSTPIATYLDIDPETSADVSRWGICWFWESVGPVHAARGFALCDDCQGYFSFDNFGAYSQHEEDPTGDTMFSGMREDLLWSITIQDRDTFAAQVASFGNAEQGMLWEKELGIVPTVKEALDLVDQWYIHFIQVEEKYSDDQPEW